jgi:8-oxo-dGTP pyrophosphatase MutT (NUDIX family)
MISLDDIHGALAGRPPALLPLGARTHAAVALVLRETSTGPEVLFIERAHHDSDPWSGDLGFPGGKVEREEEGDPRRAAERETFEETGLKLKEARHLGRLDDIAGAHLPIVVSCFVYGVKKTPVWALNEEVNDAFWFPLGDLINPERHIEAAVDFRGQRLTRPAIRLLGPEGTVLWGITYRLVRRFLDLLGHEIGRESGSKI